MPNPAVAAALALASAPTLAPVMRRRPLPEGVDGLLKVFARREEEVAFLLEQVDLDPQDFMDCIDNYIQKIVLHPGSDPYRMLGGTPSSSRASLRSNMKYLLEGLHPDKTGDSWKTAYASRVIEAWRDISSGRAAPTQLVRSSARRAKRRLPLISHPVPAAPARSFPWRTGLALLGAGVAIAYEWARVESSILSFAGSLMP